MTLDPGLVRALRGVVADDGVVTQRGRLLSYETDALTRFRQLPAAVVLPRTTEEAAAVVRLLVDAGVPLTPRGAGTGLSGGGVASPGGVLLGTARMDRILSLDPARRLARVQAGVVNTDLSAVAAPHGLHYAPDPSSQTACTLGGNVGENAGGPHCLKYGVTTRYVTGLTVVTGTGQVVELGGADRCHGLNLVGLFVGSEGLLGLATEIEVRLLPRARGVRTLLGVFPDTEVAGRAVSAIIAAGLLPAAMEMMDRGTIEAVESSVFAAGYPRDAGAVLVVEFDGTPAGLEDDARRAAEICREAGASQVRTARDEAERQALWQGRKKAYGAFGQITPDLMVQDATVPRSVLPRVLARIDEIGRRNELTVANVFHAGDGNLHPKILYDRRDEGLVARVERASREIMEACVEVGGTITGEHGVGLDKRAYMPLVHGPGELAAMAGVQRAFDPAGVWNPGKVLPTPEEGGGWGRDEGGRWGGSASFHHSPADLTVRVPGDWTVARVQEALFQAGQWLPVDGPGVLAMTVDELVRGGMDGPLAPGLGGVRDHLLGASLQARDGRRLALGGQVMKNVAGLDLVRGLVGSGAGWGRVREAVFRLLPVPGAHVVLTWSGGPAEMDATAAGLATHPVLPAGLLRTAGSPSRVHLRLLGSRAAVEAESAEIRQAFPGAVEWQFKPAGPAFVEADPLGEELGRGAGVHLAAGGGLLEVRMAELSREVLDEVLAGAADEAGPSESGLSMPCILPLWRLAWMGVPPGDPGSRLAGAAARGLRERGCDTMMRDVRGQPVAGVDTDPTVRNANPGSGQAGEELTQSELGRAVARVFGSGDRQED